jgi:hypothetical protein
MEWKAENRKTYRSERGDGNCRKEMNDTWNCKDCGTEDISSLLTYCLCGLLRNPQFETRSFLDCPDVLCLKVLVNLEFLERKDFSLFCRKFHDLANQ